MTTRERLLSRRELDRVTCASEGCTHDHHAAEGLRLASRCHPHADSQVWYREGVLHVRCSQCRKVGAKILVAALS